MDREKNSYPATKKPAKPRRAPKPVTRDRLGAIALHYLERYASSAENLRRVLIRRLQRSEALHGAEKTAKAADVDALVARYCAAGLLDDQVYATARTASLHRQGKSTRAIRQTLAIKGVAAEVIDSALDSLQDEIGAETDLAGAVNYAKRRRLGPWRSPERRSDNRERDMAALGRQGYSYDIAKRIVDAPDVATLEEELQE